MSLTEQEVLSEASEAVTEMVTAFGGLGFTFEQQLVLLADHQKVHAMISKIIDRMISDKLSSKGQTIN